MLCLSDDVIIEVAEQETVAALWTKLESLYMTKSLTNKLLQKQCLFRLRMQEGMPLRDHLENLNKILLDLRNVDVKVEDEDAALILLVSLPQSYENFVESFMTGKETLSLEDVRSALHIREDRQQATKPGHWKIDCPQIKKKLGKKKDANGSVTVAEADDANSEEELALVADEQPQCNDVWILDSGASYHLCPHREYFTTYEQIDGGNVTMANNVVCKVVLTAQKQGTLYVLRGSIVANSADIASSEVATKDMTMPWHMRLGHMGERSFSSQQVSRRVFIEEGDIDYIHGLLGSLT
ncbi:hypothetical protein SASPL_143641 [Salvia splendens]|uniref:Retrovirus-related Pol polyprotein from transposon TNT 1-94-like beta-barrel domain-containing protein n=1 Tax=Salvia splendens TaxID=180675 RepID=A0A8X8WN18_SALSN|nr:hypothetical protein SASPL_143641 [Salvia splendens]